MNPIKKFRWAFFFLLPFLLISAGNALAGAVMVDDYTPEVTARVARISFIRGDVQIKRADSDDWERADINLPIVEGDEIATDANARLEIQFNSENYLRLAENAYLKITTLRDEGIAVSLPNGSLSLRVLNFEKERAYFEIDAPKITVSVEKAGMYRVDAGDSRSSEVRVSVTDSGQAHVYSETSGFTLRNNRSATIQIDGDYAGEWQNADASRYTDEFDDWASERDAVIAKRLRDADYDKYYDRDIYGAEELNEYGDWVYTRNYGYVWKPYRTSVSSYDNWSPYRYGQWRWVAPYGWTWVNDEPWGWATYHHGRWVWDNGYWYWSPYSQYRGRRSWWRPALVVISYIGRSVCWYPLPYSYGYYNYNAYYWRRNNRTIINNNTTVIVNNYPNQTPTPNPSPNPQPNTPNPVTDVTNNGVIRTPPAAIVPPGGVTAVDIGDFGTGRTKFGVAPAKTAKDILSKAITEKTEPPVLPTYKELDGKVSREIVVKTPINNVKVAEQTKTGATTRKSGVSLDKNLRNEQIFGNRPPIEKTRETNTKSGLETNPQVRDTGAVKRREDVPANNQTPVRQLPTREVETNNNPVRTTGGKVREESQPSNVRPRNETPTYIPPRQEPQQPVKTPQPPRQEPVRQQPPRREEPAPVQPRNEPPPRREEPRPQPQPKKDPPPRKQEPAPEKKPEPVQEVKRKG